MRTLHSGITASMGPHPFHGTHPGSRLLVAAPFVAQMNLCSFKPLYGGYLNTASIPRLNNIRWGGCVAKGAPSIEVTHSVGAALPTASRTSRQSQVSALFRIGLWHHNDERSERRVETLNSPFPSISSPCHHCPVDSEAWPR